MCCWWWWKLPRHHKHFGLQNPYQGRTLPRDIDTFNKGNESGLGTSSRVLRRASVLRRRRRTGLQSRRVFAHFTQYQSLARERTLRGNISLTGTKILSLSLTENAVTHDHSTDKCNNPCYIYVETLYESNANHLFVEKSPTILSSLCPVFTFNTIGKSIC